MRPDVPARVVVLVSGSGTLLQAVLDAGADPDAANDYGAFALSEAAIAGETAAIEALLAGGASPDVKTPEGETPLLAAARAGSVPAVRLLLARGVDVNAAESFQNTTALMWASAEGHVDVADLKEEAERLRDAGVDVGIVFELTGEMRLLDVYDPDGNRIQLAEELRD